LIILGVLLMVLPSFRFDPRYLGVGEIVAGGGAMLVGVVLIALGIVQARRG
jgi:hypothetical protein